MRMNYDPGDVLMFVLGSGFAVLVVGFALFVVMAGADSLVYERRAFDAIAACEAKRAVARRQLLSSHVVCVQAIQRQDTTTVKLETR